MRPVLAFNVVTNVNFSLRVFVWFRHGRSGAGAAPHHPELARHATCDSAALLGIARHGESLRRARIFSDGEVRLFKIDGSHEKKLERGTLKTGHSPGKSTVSHFELFKVKID